MMTTNLPVKMFEHNNWANEQIILACANLSDEQLDTEPRSATLGSLRQTLTHLVAAQQGYLSLLTMPLEERHELSLAFSELQESARTSGAGLLALAGEEADRLPKAKIRTKRGYLVEPWVILVQVINHASEHREQINSMLSELQLPHPDLDGWTYGEAVHALIPPSN
jgi:uncharacterized damage-inducible protein DinB